MSEPGSDRRLFVLVGACLALSVFVLAGAAGVGFLVSRTVTRQIVRTGPRPGPRQATAPVAARPGDVVIATRGLGRAAVPATATSVEEAALVAQAFSGLVGIDESLKVFPDLAASFKISDDLTVYTFELRPGLRFSDGSALDAGACVAAFEAFLKESGDQHWVLDPIAGSTEFREGRAPHVSGLTARGAATVEIRLAEPDGIFLRNLAMPQATIWRRSTTEVDPDQAAGAERASGAVVGAGPFVMRARETTAEGLARVRFEPNPHFHGKAPAATALAFTEFTDPVDAWRRGEAQIAPADTDLRGIDPATVRTYAGLNTQYAFFDRSVPLEVRRLVNRVLDRERFCRERLGGLAVPSRGVLPPGLPGARAEARRFDAGEAPVLAAPVTLRGQLDPGLHEVLAAALAPHRVSLVRADAPPYDLVQTGWIADYPDADDFLRILFHSRQGKRSNKGEFADPVLDGWLDQARRMSADLEDEARLDLYRKAEDHVVAAAPWLFLWHQQNRILVAKDVSGLRTCACDFGTALVLPQTEVRRAGP